MIEFLTTEDKQSNYIISVNPFVVDVQILDPLGLVEFQAKYPIFRHPRILELIRLIQYTYISTPGTNTEVSPEIFAILNERFVSILKEKNVLYRIKWDKIPEAWSEKYFVLRNYVQTASLPEEELFLEENSDFENITSMLLASKKKYFYESANKSNLIYWEMQIPYDLSDQNETFLSPAGVGGSGGNPPPPPPVLPFEGDAASIFGQDMGITIYNSPQTIPED
jgi:hypothetical protein